ncbi:hypothetical protein DPMN_029996 [Dreissena polymorpha]|uniref:Uncharacterized protein n=1 Tax=Dreissena polymorpha TaxID=45954 RepID=A0A9D4LY85_DREPO|nr:hypothetical protein DPMN_029996 [Dreissena polymorpha]
MVKTTHWQSNIPRMMPLGSSGSSHSMVALLKDTNGNQIILGGPGTAEKNSKPLDSITFKNKKPSETGDAPKSFFLSQYCTIYSDKRKRLEGTVVGGTRIFFI